MSAKLFKPILRRTPPPSDCCCCVPYYVRQYQGLAPDPEPEPPPEPLPLILTFDNIANAPVDPSDVSAWNGLMVASGNPYTSVQVVGNSVHLFGGSNVVMADGCFIGNSSLVSIDDQALSVIRIGVSDLGSVVFWLTTGLTTVTMNAVVIISGDAFNLSSIVTGTFNSCEVIFDGGFIGATNLATLSIPAVITTGLVWIGNAAVSELLIDNCVTFGSISECNQLVNLSLPSCTQYGGVNQCAAIETISLPVATVCGFGGNQAAYNCPALKTFDAPSCTVLRSQAGVFEAFSFSNAIESINLPVCTTFGDTTGDDGIFNNTSGMVCTITVPVALQTADGGNPDGDLVTFIANNPASTINYV